MKIDAGYLFLTGKGKLRFVLFISQKKIQAVNDLILKRSCGIVPRRKNSFVENTECFVIAVDQRITSGRKFLVQPNPLLFQRFAARDPFLISSLFHAALAI